jgi:hypothetical protein
MWATCHLHMWATCHFHAKKNKKWDPKWHKILESILCPKPKNKLEIKNLKKKWVWIRCFQSPKIKLKKSKNHQVHIFGFHCVIENVWLNICIFFMIYNLI